MTVHHIADFKADIKADYKEKWISLRLHGRFHLDEQSKFTGQPTYAAGKPKTKLPSLDSREHYASPFCQNRRRPNRANNTHP